MSKIKIEELILRMENYLECWKQFHNFMNMARQKKFTQEDENQFMEIKSVLTQELELILCSIDCGIINREEVHSLISAGPSIRFLSEMNDNGLRNVENQWHRLLVGWQSILGQLKVKQQQTDSKSAFRSLFGGK